MVLAGAVMVGAAGCSGSAGSAPSPTDDGPVPRLGGPARAEADPESPHFTPFTVAPVLQNIEEVQRALVRAYPGDLRDRGVSGRVTIWFFVDEDGVVRNTIVDESSGWFELDRAGLEVASVYRFSPAMNEGEVVPVWVLLPITFQVRIR